MRAKEKRSSNAEIISAKMCSVKRTFAHISRRTQKDLQKHAYAISAVFQNAVHMIAELPQFIPRSYRARDVNATPTVAECNRRAKAVNLSSQNGQQAPTITAFLNSTTNYLLAS